MIKSAKQKIYKNVFEKLKNSQRSSVFKICNDELPNRLDIDKEEIIDKKITPETFNKFFINIGSNLADKIPPSSTNFELNFEF